jgi:hypothetical protein
VGVDGRSAPFRTLTRALREVPHAPIGSSSTFMPAGSYVIHLAPGTYTRSAEDAYMVDVTAGRASAGTDPFGAEFQGAIDEIPAMGGMPAVPRVPGTTLAFDQRKGTRDLPIVIQAAHPSLRPLINFRFNFRSVQHVHLKNLHIQIPVDMAATGADAVQFSRIPSGRRAAEGDLPTDHILIRGCEIDGGGVRPARPGETATDAERSVSGEVVKVNQCRSVFIERCDIHGTAAGNGNCIDFVAVQFGHVVGCDLHGCQTDWAIYTKGGSAFIRVEGNRIYDSARGFSAGEGTDVEALVPPWWHYEAYAIQFVNNLVYNITGAGVNVQGGYDILVAHNTLYNVGLGSGTSSSQMISLGYGRRNCHGGGTECADWLDVPAGQRPWVTTSSDDANMVPNRYVYILNNILLIDRSVVPGFNVFSIASDIGSRDDAAFEGDRVRDPSGPADPMDPMYRTISDPAALYPDGVSLPFPLRADADLDVRGNFVGIAGMASAIPEATLIGGSYSRSAAFYDGFRTAMSPNRNDGQAPALNTTGGRHDFLVPTTGGNVFQTETTSRVVSPLPDPVTRWEENLPALPATVRDSSTSPPRTVPVPPRDAYWMTMHNVFFDVDKVCRRSDRLPGARVRGPVTDNYVRDWTLDAASGAHDTGLEPSARPDFFMTSDVWNQRGASTTTPPTPTFNAFGQPQNETPQSATGTTPNNTMFARVSRNAVGVETTGGTAEFLFSEFGVGSNYGSLGTASFRFAADERQTIVRLPWHLSPTVSTHMCLAVQISTPDDPFVEPTLSGFAPGWPVRDTMVLNDNNKAQRNINEPPIPMAAGGAGGGAGSGAESSGITFYAVAHNAATYPRTMQLRCGTAEGAGQAPAEVRKWLGSARLEIIGAGQQGGSLFQPGLTLTLHDMQPGENRWIGVTIEAPTFKSDALPPFILDEVVDGAVVNGFAVAARPSALSAVAGENLANHVGVFSRAAAGFGIEAAGRESSRAATLHKTFTDAPRRRWWLFRLLMLVLRFASRLLGLRRWFEDDGEARLSSYADFLSADQHFLRSTVSELLGPSAGDAFGVRESLAALADAAARRDFTVTAIAHATLLNKLDALMTMLQKAQGDPADVLQNVRWQRDLYIGTPRLQELGVAAPLSNACEDFIRRFTAGEVGEDAFPDFIRASLPLYVETERAFAGGGLEARIKELEQSLGSVRAAQRSHREYLLALQSLAAQD